MHSDITLKDIIKGVGLPQGNSPSFDILKTPFLIPLSDALVLLEENIIFNTFVYFLFKKPQYFNK